MSNSLPAILELERRSRDYWDLDGIPAVAGGTCYILLGAILLPNWSANHPFLILLLGLGVFYRFGEVAVHRLKARVTYPRTGYVVPQDPRPSLIEGHFLSIREADTLDAQRRIERDRVRRQQLLLVAVVGLVIVFTLYLMGEVITDHGIFLRSVFLWAMAFVLKPDFYKFTAFEIAACPLFAILIAWLPSTRHHALGVMLIGIGFLSCLRGLATFFRYLYNSPSVNE